MTFVEDEVIRIANRVLTILYKPVPSREELDEASALITEIIDTTRYSDEINNLHPNTGYWDGVEWS